MNPLNKLATGVYKGVNTAGRAIKNVASSYTNTRKAVREMTRPHPVPKETVSPIEPLSPLKIRDNVAGSKVNPASGLMKHLQEIDK